MVMMGWRNRLKPGVAVAGVIAREDADVGSRFRFEDKWYHEYSLGRYYVQSIPVGCLAMAVPC